MAILCHRFIDNFRPGDEIPEGLYAPEVIEKWRAMGKVTVFEPPAPKPKPAAKKKAAAKK